MELRKKIKSIFRKKKEENKNSNDYMKEVTTVRFDNSELEAITSYISHRIVGQEEAIKTLLSNIKYNQMLIDEVMSNDEFDLSALQSRKVSVLLDGPTGTGKSSIINDIASKVPVPVSVANVSRFLDVDGTDFDVSNLIFDLLMQSDADIDLAERGIIILDDVDKLANNSDYSIGQIKKNAQEQITSLMNGEVYELVIQNGNQVANLTFDTSKLTFIISGNFENLKRKKLNSNGLIRTIGFEVSDEEVDEDSIKSYINSDMIPHLFEKMKVVTKTKSYDVEDYKNILLNSEISPLNTFIKTIKNFDYKNVQYDRNLINQLATDAYKMGVGATALQMLVSEAQSKVLYDLMTEKINKNASIVLTGDLIEKPKQRTRK